MIIKRKKALSLLVLIALALMYFLGPTPSMKPIEKELPVVPADLGQLNQWITEKEAKLPVREGCEAQIIWANDSLKEKTKVAVVYLHGFSSSHQEGNPAHLALAKSLGANLYLSRLHKHGLAEPKPLKSMTADGLIKTAQEALAIGRQLGDEVILVGTSTGGTLALQLAAMYPDIKALILYSPNIRIADQTSMLLNNPWGLRIARLFFGGKYRQYEAEYPVNQYWDTRYRLEALVQLEELLSNTMVKSTFQKVEQPVFMGYYYRDEAHQDQVVSVAAMRDMFKQLGTPEALKVDQPFPDANDHVIASKHKTDHYPEVIKATKTFVTEKLGYEIEQ